VDIFDDINIYTLLPSSGDNNYSKSCHRQGVRTAWVNPLTYFIRTTCVKSKALPVCDNFLCFDTKAEEKEELVEALLRAAMPKKLPAVKGDD